MVVVVVVKGGKGGKGGGLCKLYGRFFPFLFFFLMRSRGSCVVWWCGRFLFCELPYKYRPGHCD